MSFQRPVQVNSSQPLLFRAAHRWAPRAATATFSTATTTWSSARLDARQLERRAEAAVTRRRLGQRHLRHLQRRQHAGQALKLFLSHASACTACIEQAAIVGVVAQQQRADMRSATLRIGPADDNELLAVEALRLDPDPAVAWGIGSIGLLGDGALQAQLAGLRAEAGTVTGNVLAVAQAADFLLEQPLQPFLALDQRQLGRAHAIQEQEIEGEEDKLIRAAFIHRRLEAAEHRDAIAIERAQLAVEIGGLHLQGAKRLDRAPVAVRPIQACPGQQLDVAAVDARMHAVAVVLDLVQPAAARRRLVYQARELRLDPFWRPRCRSHGGSEAYRITPWRIYLLRPDCHRLATARLGARVSRTRVTPDRTREELMKKMLTLVCLGLAACDGGLHGR